MISLSLVSIFLVGGCLTRATASEPALTGTPVIVTPVDGHLLLDFHKSVIIDFTQVKYVLIDIEGDIETIREITGQPFEAKEHGDICKKTNGKLKFEIEDVSSSLDVGFSYDPLDYIDEHLTACLEDGNLVINVDEENALKNCFSEDGIQMFYIEEEKALPLKIGSNNITQENIKENLNFKITNKVGNGKREFRRATKECAKPVTESPVTKAANTPLTIGVVFGSIGLLVVTVICVAVCRKRRMKNNPDSDVEDNDDGDDLSLGL